jgi:hypothetical protein
MVIVLKLIVAQLLKKFPAFYVSRKVNAVITRAHG